MKEFFDNFLSQTVYVGIKLLIAVAIWVIGRFLIKWILKGIHKSRFSKKHDPTVVRILEHFVSISLFILLTVSVIAILGVPMASIVAVIASAGVAIGLALQGSLSNLAGGIMILLFRPFSIGDFVDATGYSGVVSDIGIFYTFLTTPDNKVVTVPNGSIMNHPVVNYSVKDIRRVDFDFSVAYGTDVEKVKTILTEEAQAHELVLQDPPVFTRLGKQDQSALSVTLRVWVKNADYWDVHFDLLERIHARFEKEHIEIPFNQMDIHVRNQSSDQ